VVFDVVHDVNAVKEAKKLGLPIVGIVDSNADPTDITYPIPMNDDAIKALQLVADYMASAVTTGKAKATKPADKTEA
jgi:small subunit ribosomal protein S2